MFFTPMFIPFFVTGAPLSAESRRTMSAMLVILTVAMFVFALLMLQSARNEAINAEIESCLSITPWPSSPRICGGKQASIIPFVENDGPTYYPFPTRPDLTDYNGRNV